MAVKDALRDIDAVVADEFDLGSRRQAREKEGSRRNAYEKSLREVRRIAGDDEMEELKGWIADYIRERGKFPSGRETRKQGAKVCRENGHEVSTGSWLGS